MGSDSSDNEEGRRFGQAKPTYCQVVSGSPGRRLGKEVSGKTREVEGGNSETSRGDSSGMMKVSQRLFSAEDVAKLIEIARIQLKKEKAQESGWTQVESKENRRSEKRYAHKLVLENQRSPESETRCWQCNRSGHISSSCPRGGGRCFTCNNSRHKRADCPLKRRATAAEKGKGKAVVEDDWEYKCLRSEGPLIIKEQREAEFGRQENKGMHKENTKEVRGLPTRGEAPVIIQKRPQVVKPTAPPDLKRKENIEKRNIATKPVFLGMSEGAVKELAALRATGGVVMKANGNPSIKDFVEALKDMCASYKDWNWKPIPIGQGVLFQFPSLGGLELLSKRTVIACKNGHFTVKRWEEDRGVKKHNFPIKATLLAFNLPPFLRSGPEISRMIEGFAHLIEAVQLYEDGGPMKLTVGCRSCAEIPRELTVVYGGMEFRVALAVRETEPRRRQETEEFRPKDTKKRSFTYLAPELITGKKKEENKASIMEVKADERAKDGIGAGGDAQSSTVPEKRSEADFANLGQTRNLTEKGIDSPSSFRIEKNRGGQKAGSSQQGMVDHQKRKATPEFLNDDGIEGKGGSSHVNGGPRSEGVSEALRKRRGEIEEYGAEVIWGKNFVHGPTVSGPNCGPSTKVGVESHEGGVFASMLVNGLNHELNDGLTDCGK